MLLKSDILEVHEYHDGSAASVAGRARGQTGTTSGDAVGRAPRAEQLGLFMKWITMLIKVIGGSRLVVRIGTTSLLALQPVDT